MRDHSSGKTEGGLPFRFETINELVDLACSKYENNTAVKYLHNEKIVDIKYSKLFIDIGVTVKYLKSASMENKYIVILGDFSYIWLVAFFSSLLSGSIVIPLNGKSVTAELLNLNIMSSVDCIIYDLEYKKKAEELSNMKSIKILQMDEIISCPENYHDINTRNNCYPNSQNPALILYTSGTTGHRKAVVLSHENISYNTMSACLCIPRGSSDSIMPILPVYHALGILSILMTICIGATLCTSRGIKYFSKDILCYKPTTMLIVPIIAKSLFRQITQKANSQNAIGFKLALMICACLQKIGINIGRIIFRPILNELGGNVNMIICGGAKLDTVINNMFTSIGICCLQGYGTTECSPLIAINSPKHNTPASVGHPIPYVSVKILDNEILVKGRVVFKGYWNNEIETEKAFHEGWYKTGDLGYFDRNGNLYVIGRADNLIVLDNGKKIIPEEIEMLFASSAIISSITVHATKISDIDVVCAKVYCSDLAAAINIEAIRGEIEKEIKNVNKQLDSYKRIKFFEITTQNPEITALGKTIRGNP